MLVVFSYGKAFPKIGIGEARLKTGSVIIFKPPVFIKTVEWPSHENLEFLNSFLLNKIDGRGLEGFLSLGGKNQSFSEGSWELGLFLSILNFGIL